MNGFSEVLSATNRRQVWEKAKMQGADGRLCYVNPEASSGTLAAMKYPPTQGSKESAQTGAYADGKNIGNNNGLSSEIEPTPDEFEMPPPPNEGPVHWAIAKIQSTFGKTEDPGWSDDDFERIATALRLCGDRNEGIRLGLRRQLMNNCGRLINLIRRNAQWSAFGERLGRISPIFDATSPAETIMEVINRNLARR